MSGAMTVGGRLSTVLVPCDALEEAREPEKAHLLFEALVNYVGAIQDAGLYTRREMPVVAIQAYHADCYLGEVCNGGHSQFISNTGLELLATVSGDALAALKAMGASAQHQILQEMIAWVEANPTEAGEQDDSSVRTAALTALDERFFEAEEQESMIPLAARWIAGWPELRAVTREEYTSEIKRLAQLQADSRRRI